jgi:peptidoglycan/xylan/chitin deacetylase (PgdA/CDA1 family)
MTRAGTSIRRRIRTAVRNIVARQQRGAVVLAYPRIADVDLDPSGLAVAPDRFAEHMAALVRIATPVPLTDLVTGRAHVARGLPRVAVTFDDGYADNLTLALPVLDRLGIPATVFVPSDAIGRTTPFWWDELEAVVFGARTLPPRLNIELAGHQLEADVYDDGGRDDVTGRHRDWRVWNGPAVTPRQRLYALLGARLRPLPAAAAERALDVISEWAGYDRSQPPRHPLLDAAGMRRLVASGQVEVGGHTVTHAQLPQLSEDRQRHEIEANRRDLESLTGMTVPAFSYPYGSCSDLTATLVGHAGFSVAVTTIGEAVTSRTDPLRVPRLGVDDWDDATFVAEVSRLLPA